MKIERTALLDIIRKSLPGIDSSSHVLLEGSDSLLFESGWLNSYNDSISVSVPLPWKELNGAVSANELFKILSKFTDAELDISVTAKTFVIAGKRAKAELTLLEDTIKAHISGILDGIKKWQPAPEDFQEALNACSIATNVCSLAGIFVTDNLMLSTDDRRINRWELQGTMDRFWISCISAVELLRFGAFSEYSVSSRWLHVKNSEGVCFSCSRLNDASWKLDKFNQIISANQQAKADLKNKIPEGLGEAVERASILFTDVGGYQAVKLVLSSKEIEVSSQNRAGKYKEVVPWADPFKKEFEPFSIFVDVNLVKYAFTRASDFYIKMSQNEKTGKQIVRLIFYSKNFTHLMTTITEK